MPGRRARRSTLAECNSRRCTLDGQTYLPSQANNLYIFPAVGMAIYATNAKRVTDEMFIEAAHAVADQVTPEQLKLGMLFPPQSNILEVEIQTAARVANWSSMRAWPAWIVRRTWWQFIRKHVYKPEYQAEVTPALALA